MIEVKAFIFNEFQVNTYILSDESGACVIVDPGCNNERSRNELSGYISARALQPVMLINTHGHIDHIAGNGFIQSAYGIPLAMNNQDSFLLGRARHFADLFAFHAEESPLPERNLEEGDEVHFGHSVLSVIHIPGHSPGSILLYSGESRLLISGDVLFNGSVGRSDLPGGDHKTLISGITGKLMVLPRETVVYPGHGPATTIGHEYDTNPFLRRG